MTTRRRNVPSLHRAFNVEWKTKNETNRVRQWMIESALDQGANPNEINPGPGILHGFTPLSTALHYGSIDVARTLLERGANPNKGIERTDISSGRLVNASPLYQMVNYKKMTDANLRALKLLLEYKADPNKGETFHGITPLQQAVINGYVDAIRVLLKHPRTRVNATNNYTGTALAYCINFRPKRLDIATLLLDKGAAPNNKEHSILFSAIRSDNPSRKSPPYLPMIELLLKYIPQKNPIVTPDGFLENTALHRVARENSPIHDDIARLLINRGANPNQTDPEGWTPLHTAVDLGRLSMIRLLLDKGADPNKQTTQGYTSLHLATYIQLTNETKRKEIIKTLLEAGANPLIRSRANNRARVIRGKTPLEINENRTPFMTTWLGERALRQRLASKALNSVEKKNNNTRKRGRTNNNNSQKSFMNIPNNIKQRILSQSGLSARNTYGRKKRRSQE
jgi:ankyrin repeat protein